MLRLVVAAEVLPVERLVVLLPGERRGRPLWGARGRLVVEVPVLRLVVAGEVLPVERRVVLLPVERLVRSF